MINTDGLPTLVQPVYCPKGMLRAGLPGRVAMRLKVLILILNKSHDAYILYSKL